MKSVLWFFFLSVALCLPTKAQNNKRLDSLLAAKRVNDPGFYRKYADSLNRISKNEEAISLFNKALTSPSIQSNTKELALIYLGLGDCYDDKQEYRKSISFYKISLPIVIALNDTELLVNNYTGLAGCYATLGSTDTGLVYSEKGLVLAESNPKKYARYLKTIYNNLGLHYNSKWNYPEALKYYYKAIDISEKTKDIDGLSSTYNNLGNLYSDLGDYKKGLMYYHKVLALQPSSYVLANIGILFSDIEKYDSSHFYIKKSIELDKKNNDKVGLSSSYTVVGNLFKKVKQFDSAMYYYKLSTQFAEEIEDMSVIENNNYNIIEVLMTQGKYNEAKPLAHKNLNSLLKGDDLSFISDAYNQLKDIYFKLGDFKKAFEFQDQYMLFKDSAQEANKSIEIRKVELNKEYEKKSTKDSLLHAQTILLSDLKHGEEIKKQQLILGGFIMILLIVAIFSVMVYKRYRVSQRQKEIINLQKNEVSKQKLLLEEKQKEIVDSINYAKRIQYTLLAHDEFLKVNLPEHCIYFNPKDIVSGDFYWATSVNTSVANGHIRSVSSSVVENNTKQPSTHRQLFYLAICDSTGHGVPGAFMSLLNIGYLSEAINEKNITQPNEIFNYVKKRLVNTISKEGQKDGFDGVLLCWDSVNNIITYAAANNRPLLIRDQKIIDQGCDRMPVGVSDKMEEFSLFQIDVLPGDVLYLYTDGYADQFGGPRGKKFKYKPLNELLLNHHTKPLDEQKTILQNNFNAWRGDLEQVDDVCVIGIKF